MTEDIYFNFAKALRRAWDGLSHAVKTQPNFQIQLVIAAFTLMIAFLINLSSRDFSIIIFTIALVLSAEMINTAFESFTDLVGSQWHRQAKIAKDVAAGMVLIVSLAAVFVGLIIFSPYLKNFF